MFKFLLIYFYCLYKDYFVIDRKNSKTKISEKQFVLLLIIKKKILNFV